MGIWGCGPECEWPLRMTRNLDIIRFGYLDVVFKHVVLVLLLGALV